MEAEDLLDKFAQDEGFGNWETVVLNCHHSVIRSVAIAAVNQALRQYGVMQQSEQLCGFFEADNKTSSATKCKCGREKWEHPKAT